MTGPLLPKPSTQSPSAPGSAASPSQSQSAGNAETPGTGQRQGSNGTAGPSGTIEPGFIAGSVSYGNAFGGDRRASFPPNTPSPMFSPTREQPPQVLKDPMMPTFAGDTAGDAGTHDPSFPLFRPNTGLDPDDDLRNGLANASPRETNSGRGGSLPGVEYDNMFLDMTHQDGEGNNDAVPSLEHETSHASEALDLIRTASNDSVNDTAELEDGDNVSKHFDDFLNGDEQN